MEIGEKLSQQRVKHIISGYRLDGNDAELFNDYLNQLLSEYSSPLIELALVETLVDTWLTVPLVRGCRFLTQAHEQLKVWEGHKVASTIAPEQFQQITGLDPSPIFGVSCLPSSSARSLPQGL